MSTDDDNTLITADQAEAWAGRALTGAEVARLRAAIPQSSIPDAISAIVATFERTAMERIWDTLRDRPGPAQLAAVAGLVERYVREVVQPAIAALARPVNDRGNSAAALAALPAGWCATRSGRALAIPHIAASTNASGSDAPVARRALRAMSGLDRMYGFDALDALGDEWLEAIGSDAVA